MFHFILFFKFDDIFSIIKYVMQFMTPANVFIFSNHRLTKEAKSVAAVIRKFQIISAPSVNILLRSTRIHSIVTSVASVGRWYTLDFRSKEMYLHFFVSLK